MPDRSRKPRRPRDPNELAKLVVDLATGGKQDTTTTSDQEGKNPAAVALGRLGGLKGGRARAKKLRPEERIRIAREAAAARWKKDDS